MKHGSIFSGIGGFDLSAEWMGWDNVFHCEQNEFGQKVLSHYWPDAELIDDVRDIEKFKKYAGAIDIISGGFPCQPFSAAGKRKGTEDERHLWPAMLEVIREIKPSWVVGENVRGLVNWSDGLVFEQVCIDLEAEGYEVQPFVLPACGIGAPHRRDRVWFIAHSEYNRDSRASGQDESESGKERISERNEIQRSVESSGLWTAAESDFIERRERRMYSKGRKETKRHISTRDTRRDGCAWKDFPTQSPICGGDDGISDRLDGITFSKWRRESIKAYGNSVVPGVVLQIFRAIEENEKKYEKRHGDD